MDSEEERILAQLKSQSKSRGPHAKSIGSVIRSLMIKRGIADEQTAMMTQEEWRRIVGEDLGKETRVGNIQRGNLSVFASSNLVVQELHFRKSAILKSLQSALPDFKIRDIRFRVDS